MTEKVEEKQSFSRKSADTRRRELIAAGIACLGKGGMAGFTIDQICKQAGVSRGLVNHHFKSKDELLTCIYAEMTDHLVQDYASENTLALLAEIIETSFDEAAFNRSNLRAWLAIWGQVSSNPALSRLHRERYNYYRDRIISAIEQRSPGVDATPPTRSVARQLIAIIDGLWLEYCLHSESFSLAAAKADCYQFLEAYGIRISARPGTAGE